MSQEPQKIIFNDSPIFWLASNRYINVPTILKYKEVPLIEVGRFEPAGYTTRISIYHPDGTYLAKVVGSRLFATTDGEKAGLTLRHPDKMTVCELGKRTLFEIRRDEAAALKTSAELNTPDGVFIKASNDVSVVALLSDRNATGYQVGRTYVVLKDLVIEDAKVGIHYDNEKELVIGVDGRVRQEWTGLDFVPPFPDMPCVALRMAPREGDPNSFGSNVRISFDPSAGPGRSADNNLNSFIRNLDGLLGIVEKERGPFLYAALDDLDQKTGRFTLFVCAEWFAGDEQASIDYLNGFLGDRIAKAEWALVRGLSTRDLSDPDLIRARSVHAGTLGNGPVLHAYKGPDGKQFLSWVLLRCVRPE